MSGYGVDCVYFSVTAYGVKGVNFSVSGYGVDCVYFSVTAYGVKCMFFSVSVYGIADICIILLFQARGPRGACGRALTELLSTACMFYGGYNSFDLFKRSNNHGK